MFTISITETDYFMPEDGTTAEQKFLALLANPGEVWMSAYSFTLQPMFGELLKADARGVKIHLLLDHSQEAGRAEAAQVKDLATRLKHGDVTITTAGINSRAPSAIWHWKGFVVKRAGNTIAGRAARTSVRRRGWKAIPPGRFRRRPGRRNSSSNSRRTGNGPAPTNRSTRFHDSGPGSPTTAFGRAAAHPAEGAITSPARNRFPGLRPGLRVRPASPAVSSPGSRAVRRCDRRRKRPPCTDTRLRRW